MAVFDIVDKSMNDISETLNEGGSTTRYTLTADVEMSQEELTAKILSMLQGDSSALQEDILAAVKANIQVEDIPNLTPAESVRLERDAKLNAWAKEIQEENLRRASSGESNWEEMLAPGLNSPPSSEYETEEYEKELAERRFRRRVKKEQLEAEQKEAETAAKLANLQAAEGWEEEEIMSDEDEEDTIAYIYEMDGRAPVSLQVCETEVRINGIPIDREELIEILSPSQKKDTIVEDWLIAATVGVVVLGFSLWMSLLACGLERMKK